MPPVAFASATTSRKIATFPVRACDGRSWKTWVSVFIEYKPRPDTSLRVELQNAGGRGIEFIRNVYTGPRNVSPLDFTDTRDTSYGRMIYVRFRKTWG